MTAYYNEFDPFAAAWLRELIAANLIAPGDVDERSIEDVKPDDLRGYTQCHFFAGIGVWSLALRLAGWSDDRPVWTGSCPCQPFSAAGKGEGFADERHLWPAFHWLIQQHAPVTVLGEQVASKDGLAWLDLVSSDLEGSGYAVGAVDTCAAGFGSPHIRQRLYWLADGVTASGGMGDAIGAGLEGHSRNGDRTPGRWLAAGSASTTSDACRLADTDGEQHHRGGNIRSRRGIEHPDGSELGRMADTASGQSRHGNLQPWRQHGLFPKDMRDRLDSRISVRPLDYWRDADWLLCRDLGGARFRPVEPGTFPLVDAGVLRNRLAAVRGAGNALNLAQAQGFIEAVMDYLETKELMR